ncbi:MULTISPECIES: hypothetical protein [Paenibacillus]|uniref:Uncharacterized protein n=1 Tax=Paenibacillus odorifer TaxID=189426 RepID=A0A1R0Y6Y2_9BACL|nr:MULTISPECIES: hypothetical protein [Paenibacillus]AIQ35309.1 hypothetical protein R50345_12225 [Paenibacillus sp. FSL R5-0345]OMD43042.1 hypothetical protein BSK52_05955 [Paenibacillus odorifer]
MNLVKLKDTIETLDKLKDSYNDVRLLIADQVRDKQMTEAKNNFEKLECLGKAIDQMDESPSIMTGTEKEACIRLQSVLLGFWH